MKRKFSTFYSSLLQAAGNSNLKYVIAMLNSLKYDWKWIRLKSGTIFGLNSNESIN
jgi:hypothetical protein